MACDHKILMHRFLSHFGDCSLSEYFMRHYRMADDGDVEPVDSTGRAIERPDEPPLLLVPVQLPKPLYDECCKYARLTGLPLSRVVSVLAARGLIAIWEQAEREVTGTQPHVPVLPN